ncbi:signal peptidase I [Patescibacteria group bacterium]|nr:signal peptidase I [Patescibacteria group bacterium]MCL5114492.1 signal peptidase I [Patescibacteria group bacterium]
MRKVFWSIVEMLETIAIAVAAVILVRAFVAQPFLVSGSSMVPTFQNGDYLLVDELTYHFRTPERGEVIVLRYPKDPAEYFIKRVIGLPGETVTIKDGRVMVTDQSEHLVLNEPYIDQPMNVSQNFTETLGSNEYFVMGDNRNYSYDSRSWGPVPSSDIVGVVRLRLWPFQDIAAFGAPAYGTSTTAG